MSINVNSTQITALLQLYPMAIPGAEENLQPPKTYDLGISQSIYSPTIKLFIVIDPVRLFSTSFTAGDSVRLWVNSLATSVIKLIKPGEENDRIFMDAPWGVLKDGLNRLYYEVTRVSGNKDQSTPILNVLFNNPVSGITVSHPPSIVPGQSPTVTLTRSDPRQFDEMELTIGSWSKTIPYVHPANPVTYNLTTLDLQQIGDGTRTVSATIKDQLSNLRVSPTTSILISANQPLIVPKLISVLDATGNDVPEGNTTSSTSLTLHGEASAGRQVEIYDGSGPSAVPKGKVTADPTTGTWVLTITVPSGARRLYAKSLYHPTNTYSNVRNLKVVAYVVVAFLNGPYTATAGDQLGGIELSLTQNGQPIVGIIKVTLPQGTRFADGTSTKDFTTGVDGKVTINGATAGSVQGVFSITASSSETTVSAELSIRPPDLAIDTTEMELDGVMIVNPYGWPTNEMAGNTATRTATGGVPPYSYMSANTLVAQVSSSGKVTGLKNGITKITVTDAANQSVSYSAKVLNVYQLLVNNALLTADEGKTWIQSVGGVNSYNIIQYVTPSLVNPVRDLYENRIYPDPLGSRIYQYVATQVNFLCWNGSIIGGLGLLYGDSKRIRAFTCIPT
ncbi:MULTISPECIES: hypothetical protein [unclassified Pseudomonas]|nr:hypothetical protein [Pseudomonas sp. CH235]TEA58636.1 hypothetical protein EIY71_26920 [Pseudomonas sp. CH235]